MPMLEIAADDEGLSAMIGAEIRCNDVRGGYYRIDHPLGQGGMSIAFLAMQIAPEGISPVVLKVPRPSLLRHSNRADLTTRKETTALRRLNERVPPTPFVVRLIEADTLIVHLGGASCPLPWLSIEYVHGGAEGTTLEQRVRTSVVRTGSAFDAMRAALAVDCMCRGLRAVHEVGVVHRDLTPRNVLCCGFADSEIFKIADFGIARPLGMSATFGASFPIIGTPGYAAPEQLSSNARLEGTWSDVFSLGCLIFYVLTGEPYFPITNMSQAMSAPYRPERRRISESRALSREFAERPDICHAIDRILASATAGDAERRPASVEVLSALLLPLLRIEPSHARPSSSVMRLCPSDAPPRVRSWTFTTKQRPRQDRSIRAAGWDGDGRCVAATTRGLEFWNGTAWVATSTDGLLQDDDVRFVQRMSAGRWLLGGADASLVVLTSAGPTPIARAPTDTGPFHLASGEIRDLAIFVGTSPTGSPVLHSICGGRWLKALPIPELATVSSLARLDDERWLLAGAGNDGSACFAIVQPTAWTVECWPVADVPGLFACASDRDRQSAIMTGTNGTVIQLDAVGVRTTHLDTRGVLSAAAIDGAGTRWVGETGRLWTLASHGAAWEPVWRDTSWSSPWISLLVDVGIVRGLSADGAILEGRFDAMADTVACDLRLL